MEVNESGTVVAFTDFPQVGGGGLPYIRYIGMCRLKGYGFGPFWSELSIVVLNRVSFSREQRERINIFVFSTPNE